MAKTSIMVVEDEGVVSIDIRNILRRSGYDIAAVAFLGEEAIKKAEDTHPDLVLMDIGLKGKIDGIEAAKIIRERHHIPIVFLTGFADENTLDRAKEATPSGLIIKPINEEELRNAIEHALTGTKPE